MTDPGKFGDDGDVALDAALAAADEDMLAAIGNRLELDVGLARILKDLGGSSVTHPGIQAPAHPGKDRRIPDATSSPNPSRRIHTGSADAASPIRIALLIRDLNASDKAVEDLYLRARQAAGIAARGEHAAGQAGASARRTEDAHLVIQARQPGRHAPLPRQVTLALGTVALNGLACYAAARALGGSQAAGLAWTGSFLAVLAGGEAALGFYRDRSERAWRAPVMVIGFSVILLGGLRLWFLTATGTGLVPATAGAFLFMVTTAGFLALGNRALRAAETVPTWRARRQACRAGQAARIARAAAGRNVAERDRLIDAYLGQVRRQVRKTFPAGRQLAVESGIRKHLLGERPLMELESWCPSRAASPRRLTGLRTGSWITRWIRHASSAQRALRC